MRQNHPDQYINQAIAAWPGLGQIVYELFLYKSDGGTREKND